LKERKKIREDEEEDFSRYGIGVRKREDAENWQRKHSIALCGAFALAEVMDMCMS
jgi:hypothetical protein